MVAGEGKADRRAGAEAGMLLWPAGGRGGVWGVCGVRGVCLPCDVWDVAVAGVWAERRARGEGSAVRQVRRADAVLGCVVWVKHGV